MIQDTVLLFKNSGFKILEESSEPVADFFFGQVMAPPFLCCHSLQGSVSLPMLRCSSRVWGRAALRSCRFASHSLGEEPRDRDAAVGQVTGGSQEGDNGSLLCIPQGTDGGW